MRPRVVDSSHNLLGYEAPCAADGDDSTFWMVPGGQRMEMMSCALASFPDPMLSDSARRPFIPSCPLQARQMAGV